MARALTGFTLIELLIVISICSLVLLHSFPSFSRMVTRNSTTAEINRVIASINLARHSAVNYQTVATLCHLKINLRCGGTWGEDLTVFLDHNRNARLDQGEPVISVVQQLNAGHSVKWRSFKNRSYLQMMPMGYTNYQNGNVTVCPRSGDVSQARQLVLNVQGRVRINHRINGAGDPIDRNGKLLRC